VDQVVWIELLVVVAAGLSLPNQPEIGWLLQVIQYFKQTSRIKTLNWAT
jgi:hypothetical protein